MYYVPKFPIIEQAAGTELGRALIDFATVALRVEIANDYHIIHRLCWHRDMSRLAPIVAWVRDCGPIATQPGGLAYDLAAGLIERFRYEHQRVQLWPELDHLLPAYRVFMALAIARSFAPSAEFYDAIHCELMSALHEREIYLPDFDALINLATRTPR